ncbi:hypothetical protein MTR67_021950 [Solanum verrucosum]|uniref:Uncharacterized protein n=1 Tax=Solanum verrucosum TaxID=315347 RepID=A0AAF0QTS9_SOLVR|nr:hypothetical protein MTR67_021950 [Solanum verrucosum]
MLDTYNIPITPLPDQNEWNVPRYIKDDIVRPPKHKKLPGRPSHKYRDKAYNKLYGKKSKNSCSTCGFKRHNMRSCRNESRIVQLMMLEFYILLEWNCFPISNALCFIYLLVWNSLNMCSTEMYSYSCYEFI